VIKEVSNIKEGVMEIQKELLRLAKQDPELKTRILAILKASKQASLSTDDSAAFSAWCKMSNPNGMSEAEVLKYLAKNGVSISQPGETAVVRKKGPIEVGEIVKIDTSKCLHPDNKKNCGKLEHTPEVPLCNVVVDVICPADLNEFCTIKISPIDLETGRVSSKKFEFTAVYPKRITGLTKKLEKAQGDQNKVDVVLKELRNKSLTPHDGVGIYRTGFSSLNSYQKFLETPPTPKAPFVLVYERGGKLPVPQMRKQYIDKANVDRTRQTLQFGDFDDLVDGGIDAYANIYYEGDVTKAGYGKKDGAFYFMMVAEGQGFTAISPSKGTVYYIAKASEMPSQAEWQEDLRERLKAVVEAHLRENI
jgi:hypothetical protein